MAAVLNPQSLCEVSQRINRDVQAGKPAMEVMSYHMSNFRHEVRGRDAQWIQLAITAEPDRVTDVIDVWLAGLADYLSHHYQLSPPAWTAQAFRFFDEPVYLGSPSLRNYQKAHTPDAWSRRHLYCGETSF